MSGMNFNHSDAQAFTTKVGNYLPIANGGMGFGTAQEGIDALTQVSGATNEYVLTKDTASGNALWKASVGIGDALVANPLSQFAATTSAQLAGVMSDETGSGSLVFGTSPNITTPTGIVKGDVGLGNVDNTSDATKNAATVSLTNKTISTATNTITFAANQAFGSNKITGLANGTAANDAVNFSQLSAITGGLLPQDPILASNVIDDTLTAPPGGKAVFDAYIVGASATGAWAGLDGHLVQWDGAAWVDITGAALQVGDRIGVTFESGTAAGGLVGNGDAIAVVATNTPGSFTYTFNAPADRWTASANGTNAIDKGHVYYYNGTSVAWVEYITGSTPLAGNGLTLSGATIVIDTAITADLSTAQTFTNKTVTSPVLTLTQSVTPTPTVEGRIEWDTDGNQIAIGDGAGTKIFSDDAVTLARANHTGTQLASTISDFDAQVATTAILQTDNLSALASTTSAQLLGVISDETGTGSLVFATSPSLVTPSIAGLISTSYMTVQRTATAVSTTSGTETYIGVTDTSAARTITLQTADAVAGRMYIIKDESGAAATNNITIATQGAELLDGQATLSITVNYGVGRFISDGTNWFTI